MTDTRDAQNLTKDKSLRHGCLIVLAGWSLAIALCVLLARFHLLPF